MQRTQQGERGDKLADDEADRRADPVQRGEAGDGTGEQECRGHDMAVVVVEQV